MEPEARRRLVKVFVLERTEDNFCLRHLYSSWDAAMEGVRRRGLGFGWHVVVFERGIQSNELAIPVEGPNAKPEADGAKP